MPPDAASAPAGAPAAGAARRRRSPGTLLTWATAVVLLIVVVVLVLVKASTGSQPVDQAPQIAPAPGGLVSEVTGIPASEYDAVGTTSPGVLVTPPAAVPGHPPLRQDGKGVVFFYGAEFCPYCGGEAWALVAALSRFGTIGHLGLIRSSGTDTPAGIESFTLRDVTYASKYLALQAVERRSDYDPTGAGYTSLTRPDAAQVRLLTTFHVTGYPFIDFGNRYVTAGPSYSPTFLSGLTWSEIGSYLSDPHVPVTEAIVTLANYYTAALCVETGGRPASVCGSTGVADAAFAMGVDRRP